MSRSRRAGFDGRFSAWLVALSLLAALVPAPALPAQATTRVTTVATWTGGGDGVSWYDPDNWDIGVVPDGFLDTSVSPSVIVMYSAVLPAEANVVHDEATQTVLQDLVVQSEASLEVTAGRIDARSDDALNENFAGFGTVSIAGRLQIGGSIARVRSHELSVDGDLVLTTNAGYELYNRGTDGSPDRTVAGNGTIQLDHSQSLGVPHFSFIGLGGVITFPSSLSIEGNGGTFFGNNGSSSDTMTLHFLGAITATDTGSEILLGHGSGHQTVVMDNVTTVDGGDLHFFAEETVARGTIHASNGGRVEASFPNPFFAGATFTNEGAIQVDSGTLSLDTAWANPGSISTTNSSVDLRGTFTTAGYESIQRVDSPVEINGVMDNTGDTYLVDHSDGEVVLSRGTIVGGTVDARNQSIRTFSAETSTLQDTVYQGELTLIAGDTTARGVRIEEAITFDPSTTNQVTLSGASIGFVGTNEILMGGIADVVLDPTLTTSINPSAILLASPDADLHIRPGISISGSDGTIGYGLVTNSTLTMEGTIAATGPRPINFGSGSGVNTTVNDGEIHVSGTGRLGLSGEVFANLGLIEATDGGTVQYTDANNSSLPDEYKFQNELGGTIRVGAGSTFTLLDTPGTPLSAVNTGVIDLSDGGLIESTGEPTPINNLGGITGSGTVATDVINDWIISPGIDVGVLEIDGSLQLGSEGRLDVDVDGLAPGTGHDQVVVTGDVAVGGELAIDVDPAVTPSDDDTLTIITSAGATGVTGTFDSQTGGFTSNDRYLSPVYLAAAVDLLVGDPPNRPPVIDPIAAQAVDEETTLTVPIPVSDPDGDPVALSLSGEPAGASIVDGDLVWTPTEAQGPASYTFDVVADDGQGGTDTEEVTIDVAEVNRAPIVDSIDPITVTAGDPVFFTATATDPDIPANSFTWSLSKGAPLGASIDPDTGEFVWGGAATAQRHTFSVIATDDGDPPEQGFTSVTIEVEPATVLISITEQVGVADDPVVRPPVEIFVSEAVGVADDPVVRPPVEIFVSEAVGVADDPVITTIQSGTVLGLRSGADGIVDGVVAVDDSVIFQGGGFAPDTEIIIELLSDPILLGTTTSDVDGRFSRQVIIPLVEPGEHLLVARGLAPAGNPHQVLVRLRVVLPADVSLLDFDPAVGVSEPGGTSVPFTLAASITTPYEDGTALSDGNPMIELVPVGPGETVVGDCSFDDTILSCDFDEVPVNTYSVEASIGHPYDGRDEGVLVVYDPSLGFTTGGGWFYWPGTEDKTSFGYTTKYNKKATNVQGSFLLIRHLDDGTKYRVKSNALDGLSLGSGDGFGWASFTGKATYQEPGWAEPVGNHLFVVYAEDVLGDDDRFWLQVADKDGEPVVLSMNSPAVEEAAGLVGGNIVVPHTPPAGVE